jgi:hypothetical protein
MDPINFIFEQLNGLMIISTRQFLGFPTTIVRNQDKNQN